MKQANVIMYASALCGYDELHALEECGKLGWLLKSEAFASD